MSDNIILKMTGIEKRFKGVYALKNLGVVQGVGNNRFNSKNTASRAELVTVLCRILDL